LILREVCNGALIKQLSQGRSLSCRTRACLGLSIGTSRWQQGRDQHLGTRTLSDRTRQIFASHRCQPCTVSKGSYGRQRPEHRPKGEEANVENLLFRLSRSSAVGLWLTDSDEFPKCRTLTELRAVETCYANLHDVQEAQPYATWTFRHEDLDESESPNCFRDTRSGSRATCIIQREALIGPSRDSRQRIRLLLAVYQIIRVLQPGIWHDLENANAGLLCSALGPLHRTGVSAVARLSPAKGLAALVQVENPERRTCLGNAAGKQEWRASSSIGMGVFNTQGLQSTSAIASIPKRRTKL
jgi:hypothetical protein